MSPKMPGVKPRKALAALKKAGFYVHHQRGSHITLKHFGSCQESNPFLITTVTSTVRPYRELLGRLA